MYTCYVVLYIFPSGHLNGELYSVTNNRRIYSISFDAINSQASIEELFLEGNSNFSLEAESSGEGLSLEKPINQNLVFDILHHHLYIVVERTIYIILLNASNAYQSYDTISIDYDPISINAFNFGHDPYIMAVYEASGERTFVQRYRKYQNSNWGNFGNRVLVTSPQWNDLSRVSNILVYKAFDSLNYYDSLYVVISEGWYMYVTNLIDGTSNTYLTPEPCNNIVKMVYNEHTQRMLIQCQEGTVLLDAREKEFRSLWMDVTGDTYIAQSGKYGAVINETFVTILDLNEGFATDSVPIERFANGVFVDSSSKNHFFCFVQQLNESYTVDCIRIEELLNNGSDYLINIFDSSIPPMDQMYTSCPNLYSHRNLLTIEHIVCSTSMDNCLPLMQIFDMRTVLNSYNVSGLQAGLLAYKQSRYEVPTTDTPTSTVMETTELPTTTLSVTDEVLTEEHTPVAAITAGDKTTVQIPTEPNPEPTNLKQCTVQLQKATNNFHMLLYIALSVLVLLSVLIMLLCVLLCCAIRKIKYHGLYDPYNQATTVFRVTKRRNTVTPPDKVVT